MTKWKDISRARDQLYHLKVAWRQFEEQHQPKRRTTELRQVMDIMASIVENACDAFAGGRILEVLVNQYSPTRLPGFGTEVPAHLQHEFENLVRDQQEGVELHPSRAMQEWIDEQLKDGIDPF